MWRGGGTWGTGHHAGERGCDLQRRGWPGSLQLPQSCWAMERLPPSPAAPVPPRPHRRGTASPWSPQWRSRSQPGSQTHTPASSISRWPLRRSSPTGTLVTRPAVPAQGCAGGGAMRALGMMVAIAPREWRWEGDLMLRGLRLPEALGSVGWWKRQLRVSLPGGGGRLSVSQKPSFVLCF